MNRHRAVRRFAVKPLCCLISLVCYAQAGAVWGVEPGSTRIRSFAMPREVRDVPPIPPVVSGQIQLAAAPAEEEDLPLGRDALFGTPSDDESEVAPGAGSSDAEEKPIVAEKGSLPFRGFVEFTPAYTYSSPGHWSRAVVRTQIETRGTVGSNAKWKASLRLDVDPVYYGTDFYPDPVKKDQRLELLVRETYVDLSLPANWELRLGRQHVVWGEAVALFFADVVSARDMRDFILPEFDILRIPQWAARAEYFGDKAHFELLWVPFPSYDEIGKPGGEFYPYSPAPVPGFNQVIRDTDHPARTLSNTNFGSRVSGLIGGWDLSGFYYRSNSVAPTLYRQVELSPSPQLVYEPRHDRIWQAGGTLAKDLGGVVLKGETVYTEGRKYEVSDPASTTGVVAQNTLDYLLSLDFTLPRDGRLNLQAFQRVFFDHDEDIFFDQFETGFSVLVGARLWPKIEPELLYVQSLNSNDRMLRPSITWHALPNLRITGGVDIFAGPQYGVFGRFGDSDRVYAEVRYSF